MRDDTQLRLLDPCNRDDVEIPWNPLDPGSPYADHRHRGDGTRAFAHHVRPVAVLAVRMNHQDSGVSARIETRLELVAPKEMVRSADEIAFGLEDQARV